ncbi:heme o synthase [Vibrio fluvialis]|jgi:protoheme IX farnesyltransferase|uniref:Protoheme IX farnesyltransferase n=2 Tax=root TaxID=1 RepID=A0AAX2LU35_VIBFL|nr:MULTISPECIES: heme o synthase [Vibrio]TNF16335.1 MAG: protoheme IX farnesyltransferase [Vibrionaceae bacterium]HDM8035424.1 protoheme IX farnesyltransferase [Vibrio fluvialis clinical-1]AMF93281.1 protoheme IX farnesyltransferase [Vibrio fluvialis]AVH33489.1 protoheme IX farnesyltransferase [Vibrio fluvialis]EKO3373242.1 protoheme IX farnesyltransferase [Vibrio fluvialis]
MIKGYISITKPGIIIGNLISVAAGYFLAAKSEAADVALLAYTLAGVAMVIASGCVVNNIFDRDIDLRMDRTRGRLLAQGEINVDHAFVYAIALLLGGTALLYRMANPLSTVVVLLGYVFYVFFYTMWYKRTSVYGTLVGSVSGAVPPLVGYLAVTNYISLEAVLLFALFCLWQMPHSYAIAMFRMQDYKTAGIPVLPVVSGIEKARKHMMAYVVAFNLVALALFLLGECGYEYLVIASAVCFMWTKVTFKPVTEDNYVEWSKTVFKVSLLVVMGISSVLGLELIPLTI